MRQPQLALGIMIADREDFASSFLNFVAPPQKCPLRALRCQRFGEVRAYAPAAVMAVQVYRNLIPRGEALGVLTFAIIGVTLIVLAPAKPSGELASAAGV